MANASYPSFREALMTGAVNLATGVIKVALVRGYTYNSAHVYLGDVTTAGGVLNGTSAALAGKTFTGGIFDADDTTITTTASAANHALIIYQASAAGGGADLTAAAQRVLLYLDTGTNLPIQPGTGTLTLTFPNTTERIYRIGQ
jgi:hypothetical protein